jgi:hypothetical protein
MTPERSAKKIILLVVLLCTSGQLHAGDIEPRAYVNTPVGVNFMLLSYAYSDGALSTTAASPIQDASLRIDTEVLAYARSLDVMGHAAKIDMALPYSSLSGTAILDDQVQERNVGGLHDPSFRFSFLFYGAPALSLQEFGSYQQDLIVGGSIQVSPPLGQYEADKLVNLGSNRWFIRPDIGLSKAWGAFTAELSSGAYIFTDNNNFLGGKTQEQAPLYSSQLHLTYSFSHGVWFALSGTYDHGGRTRVDGIWNNDEQENSRMGATLAVTINKNNSIKLYASNGVRASKGADYQLMGAAWQYRWGSGL